MSHQLGALADGTQWLLLGRVEMLLTRRRILHPGSEPGNGLSMDCAARDVPGSLWYLLLGVLRPISYTHTDTHTKKKGSEVEGNIPGAAGWAALLYFLRTKIIVA